jgi:hypothetical protein
MLNKVSSLILKNARVWTVDDKLPSASAAPRQARGGPEPSRRAAEGSPAGVGPTRGCSPEVHASAAAAAPEVTAATAKAAAAPEVTAATSKVTAATSKVTAAPRVTAAAPRHAAAKSSLGLSLARERQQH